MQDSLADVLASPLSRPTPRAAVATAPPAGPHDPPPVVRVAPLFNLPAPRPAAGPRPTANPPRPVAGPVVSYVDRWVIWPGNEHLDLLERRWSNGAIEYPYYRATSRPLARLRFSGYSD